jgi:hypothetical protein
MSHRFLIVAQDLYQTRQFLRDLMSGKSSRRSISKRRYRRPIYGIHGIADRLKILLSTRDTNATPRAHLVSVADHPRAHNRVK